MTHSENCEIWIDIPNTSGNYQVSNYGKVKSKARTKSNGKGVVTISERHLIPRDNGFGYLSVMLYKDGKAKQHKVHRLVLLAFVGDNDLQCDHINGNRQDNRLVNLRYCTPRQNKVYSIDKNKTSSRYIGVTKRKNKWIASCTINGNQKYLGVYNCEFAAYHAYLNATKTS